jgi:hypothetical protein
MTIHLLGSAVKLQTGYASKWRHWAPSGAGYVEILRDLLGETHEYPDGRHLPREFLFVDRSGGPDRPYYVFEIVIGTDGTPRVRSVLVHAHDEGREVRAGDLRQLRSIEEVIEQACALAGRPALDEPSAEVEGDWQSYRRMVRGARRQARRRATPDLLREIAEVYQGAAHTGAPTKAVREHFGIAESTASLYVKRARTAGVLPAGAGR